MTIADAPSSSFRSRTARALQALLLAVVAAHAGSVAAEMPAAVAASAAASAAPPPEPRPTACPAVALPSPNGTLFTDVRIFDGRSARLSPPSTVLVTGNRIARIATGSRAFEAPGAVVVDGRGGTLLPGLVDTHVHLTIAMFPPRIADSDRGYVDALALAGACRMLLRGFTSVRDMGGPAMGLKQAIDEGFAAGPRIYPSGAVITTTGGHADARGPLDPPTESGGTPYPTERAGWFSRADGESAVLVAAREQLRLGATQIKVMAGGGVGSPRTPLDLLAFRPDELRAAVDAARDRGTYVAAHIYTSEGIRRALEAGVMSIEHGHLIDEPTMRLLAEKGAFLSTQAYIFFAERGPVPPEQRPKLLQAREGADRMFGLAKKLDARLPFSTDMAGPLSWQAQQNREFGARARWFTPAEILRQATSDGAALLALSGPRDPYPGPRGAIAEGAVADLLLVDGDPLADLSLMERPETSLRVVMKDGVAWRRD
jgi:imidazolonepropionase-like amidohydrolase